MQHPIYAKPGRFKDGVAEQLQRTELLDQLAVQKPQASSHSAGFEVAQYQSTCSRKESSALHYVNLVCTKAWMRSRGENGTAVFTADTMAARFGVTKDTYDAVPLPHISSYKVRLASPPPTVATD